MDVNKVKSQIMSGAIWKFFERFSAQAVSFVISLILARLLEPDAYAVVAMVNVFLSLAEVFITSGLNTALIQNKEAGTNEFSTVFYCNCILSVVLYAVLFFTAPFLSNFYRMPQLTVVLRVVGLRLILSAVQAIQVAYVSKKMQFKKFFISTLSGTVVSGAVGIGMAVAGFGVWALVAQIMVSTVVNTLVLYITVEWRPTWYFNLKNAVSMLKFGVNVMCSNLIGTLFNQLHSLIIGRAYTANDLAYYDKGKNLPRLVNDNVASSLQTVLFPAMSNVGEPEAVKAIAKKSSRMMSFIMFPLMVGLIAVAEPMIYVLLTEKWVPAIPYIRIIALEGIIGVIDSANGLQVLRALGYSGKTLQLEFIKKPLALLIIFLAIPYGVTVLAWTVPLTALFAMIINTAAAGKVSGYRLWEQVKDCAPAFWMSGVMGICVYAVSLLGMSHFATLILQIVLGIMIYVGLSILTKNTEFGSLWAVVKNILKRGKKDGN